MRARCAMLACVALLAPLLTAFAAYSADAAPPQSSPILLVPSAHEGGMGDQGGVRLLATQSSSDWFATLGMDGTLCIWNAADARFLAKRAAAEVQTLAILPHSHLAIVSTIDTLRVIDVDTFTIAKSAKLNEPLVQLFAAPDGRLFGLSLQSLYRIDPATLGMKLLARIGGGMFDLSRMSPDGNLIAVVTGLDPNSRHLVIFDTRDGTPTLSKDVPGQVQAIDLGSDLVVIGSDGHILALGIPGGNQVADVAVKNYTLALLLLPGHSGKGGPHEVLNAYPGGNERVDLTAGRVAQQVAYDKAFSELAHSGASIIATGPALGVPSICDASTLRCVAPTAIHGSEVTQVKTLGENDLLLVDAQGNATRMDETLRIKRLYLGRTLTLVPRWKGEAGPFALSQGGWVNNALFPSNPPNLLSLSSPLPMAAPIPMAACSDGRYLVSEPVSIPGGPLQVAIYDLSKIAPELFATPPLVGTWVLTGEKSAPLNNPESLQFGFTPDGRMLLAVNVNTGATQRYDLASAHELPALPPPASVKSSFGLGPGPVTSWAIRADGSAVILARYETLQSVPLDGGSGTAVTVSEPVASIVAGGSASVYISLQDGSVLRWDASGQPVAVTNLPYPSRSMLYIAERNWLVANSADGSTRFLDAGSGQVLMSLMLFANGRDWLLWTPAGLFDASDGAWSGLRWKFSADTFAGSEPVQDFFDQFYTPGLVAAVLAGTRPKLAQLLALKDRRTGTLDLTAGHVTGGKVSLDLQAKSAGGVAVRDVHLFRNGVLLKTWSGDVPAGRHLQMTADLVAGPNRFRAYAFNQSNVKTSDAIAQVTGPATLKRPSDLYVVAIGINDYKNQALHLNYARQDAQLAAAALTVQRQDVKLTASQLAAHPQPDAFGAAVLAAATTAPEAPPGDIHVTTLLDGEATRERILKTLADVSGQVRPEDSLVIYYAGHGIAVGDRYYLLPQDLDFAGAPSELLDPRSAVLARSAISDVDLTNVLAGEQAATAALIIDACQSGEIVGDKLAEHRGPANSRGLAQLAYDKRIYILAASLSTQKAAELQGLEHGVLTYGLMMEGLLQDRASAEQTGVGPGTTNVAQWLDWAANNVAVAAPKGTGGRGFEGPDVIGSSEAIQIQQPRLFAPPQLEAEPAPNVTVAYRPLLLDPLTMTVAGFIPSRTLRAPPLSATARPAVLYQPSTLGNLESGVMSADGREFVGLGDNRIVALDPKNGAVLWTHTADEDLVSLDLSPTGEVATLGHSGKVSITTRAATPEVIEVVKGYGYTVNGLVRWLGHGANLLVVTNNLLALYSRQGTLLQSVDLTKDAAQISTLSGRGDLLYIADAGGKVRTYQLPSLTPAAVVESAQPGPQLPIPGPFLTSMVVDPDGRHLIRIRNDGSFFQTRLPQTADDHPLIKSDRIQAALFSADGARLFVADSAGTLRMIDAASGAERKSWPSGMRKIDTLAMDAAGSVLVATGGGAIGAWRLPGADTETVIPGGQLLTTAAAQGAGSVNVTIAADDSISSFQLPDPGAVSRIPWPRGLNIALPGKTNAALSVWISGNPGVSKSLSVQDTRYLSVTPDGRVLAWVSRSPTGASAQILDASTGAAVRSVALAGLPGALELSADGSSLFYLLGEHLHQHPMNGDPETDAIVPHAFWDAMKSSPSGTELLLSSAQGQVILYDLKRFRIRRSLQLHAAVESIDFVPSGDAAVVVTHDGEVHLWKTSTTEEPLLLGTIEGRVTGVSFSRSTSTVLIGSDQGKIGWFALTGSDQGEIATSTWLQSTRSWLTVANDGRFEVAGDSSTPVAVTAAADSTWQAASRQPGFTPGLLKQLAAR